MLLNFPLPKYFIVGFLLCIEFAIGQTSFQGLILFDTKIETTDLAPDDYDEKLLYNYGKHLSIFYLESGNFARKYHNTGKYGQFVQFYFGDKGKLILTIKKSSKVDTLDVTENSLKLIEYRKANNEDIMGLDCDCYEFVAFDKSMEEIVIKYCSSEETPKIDAELFDLHKDFFLSDFFSLTNRPYLKFSMKTKLFELSYTAKMIEQKTITMDEVLKNE